MRDIITKLLFPDTYIPHGHCYLWQPSLMWLHIISDAFIALAYYSIPIILLYFVYKRQNMPFKGIFILFSAFILSCGTTHIVSVWTLWTPVYWLSGAIKAFTALISAYTAVALVPLIPQALSLPSPVELEGLNHQLEGQIKERKAAEKIVRQLNEQLEERVKQRTAELEETNQKLQLEISERQQIEAALRDNQRFTKRIADLTPNLLYVYDITEQCNIYCNHFIIEILGYTVEEIKEMKTDIFTQLIHLNDRHIMQQYRQRCLSLRDDDCLEIECRLKDSKNNWHWIQARTTIFARTKTNQARQLLTVAADITERKNAELALQKVNQQLAERVEELESRTQEMILLGEMTDFLQACLSVAEAEKTLSDLLRPLFSNFSGAIFSLKSSRDFLEMVASWGEFKHTKNILTPDECWGLRRGTPHIGQASSPNLYCRHIEQEKTLETTLCVPMMAQGETIGLLYLHLPSHRLITPAEKRLAATVSKQIAISLANLKLRETLQYQSFRDPLTGMFNRRYLDASLSREIHRVNREQKPLGIIMIDIDYFKQFNDTFGHEIGDFVLQTVGKFLRDNIRQYDIACRYGGEELTVILPNASLDITKERAEEIRQGIKNLQLTYGEQTLQKITVSLGIAALPDHGETAEELLRKADDALFKAKKQGRDRVVSA